MNSLNHLRAKALLLREKKKSIDDIAELINVSRSTIAYWVKGIPIPRTEKQSAAQRAGSRALHEKALLLREQWYLDGKKEFQELLSVDGFANFVVIYMTEGYRKTKWCPSVSNQNPKIIRCALKFFEKFSTAKIRASVTIYPDIKRSEVIKFWSEFLGIKPSSIKIFYKRNSGSMSGRNHASHYGVFSVGVNDTRLKCRIDAWMECMQENW